MRVAPRRPLVLVGRAVAPDVLDRVPGFDDLGHRAEVVEER